MDEHINMLDRGAPKFQSADLSRWEKIIRDAANYIKSTWAEDTEFNRDIIISVCKLSFKLGSFF